mmetsp:Transcript_10587/g.24178  ORF Transcript_10587/g.24178 Transcript_10587/m.24178 type:complete len:82 (+) Transcript_10587:1349-1594(+)|eukprot:752218-Hanusia_phi.AAC.8
MPDDVLTTLSPGNSPCRFAIRADVGRKRELQGFCQCGGAEPSLERRSDGRRERGRGTGQVSVSEEEREGSGRGGKLKPEQR